MCAVASKILSEIKTYKKSLILYVVVFFVMYRGGFLDNGRYFFYVSKYFPEILVFVVITLILFTIWRIIFGKDNVVNLSKRCFVFFFWILIAYIFWFVFNLFCCLSSDMRLQLSHVGGIRNPFWLHYLTVPIKAYMVFFLLFQSIYMIFFLLIPGGGNNAKTVDIRPMFYTVVLIFAATVVEVFWVNFGDLYF